MVAGRVAWLVLNLFFVETCWNLHWRTIQIITITIELSIRTLARAALSPSNFQINAGRVRLGLSTRARVFSQTIELILIEGSPFSDEWPNPNPNHNHNHNPNPNPNATLTLTLTPTLANPNPNPNPNPHPNPNPNPNPNPS